MEYSGVKHIIIKSFVFVMSIFFVPGCKTVPAEQCPYSVSQLEINTDSDLRLVSFLLTNLADKCIVQACFVVTFENEDEAESETDMMISYRCVIFPQVTVPIILTIQPFNDTGLGSDCFVSVKKIKYEDRTVWTDPFGMYGNAAEIQ